MADDLIYDLELERLFEAASAGDELVERAFRVGLLTSLANADEIRYRQEILKDCMNNTETIKRLYEIANDAIKKEKELFLWHFSKTPASVLRSSVRLLEALLDSLRKLQSLAAEVHERFSSEGFVAFFGTIKSELTDDYLEQLSNHLERLEFKNGILFSAKLGEGNRGVDYVLRKIEEEGSGLKKIFKRASGYTFSINERDEAGFKALSQLKDEGLFRVAEALHRASRHVLGFFISLQHETAFWLGWLNLRERFESISSSLCIPEIGSSRKREIRSLCDPVLLLSIGSKCVENDFYSSGQPLVFITGANQGGKSVFLRALGIAQLMMQAGGFVCAESCRLPVVRGVFTHFKRMEDKEMESGKFDEEMRRMNMIVDRLKKHSLVLFNESFASTNELEGSEVAIGILNAFIEKSIESFFVTHMYRLVAEFYVHKRDKVLFLRAERDTEGKRTFKILPAEPLSTSYGRDLYAEIFSS